VADLVRTGRRFLGSKAAHASKAGATASYAFSGRAIAFVTTKGPDRGKAEI
jgi:hypothetical protein